MNHSFTYIFDELPLVTEAGFQAFLMSGEATIEYSSECDWVVTDIYSEGYRRTKYTLEDRVAAQQTGTSLPFFDKRLVALDHAGPLFGMILHVLENDWQDKVQDAIREDMFERQLAAEEDWADQRRDRQMAAE
jgi:hypothetical protein